MLPLLPRISRLLQLLLLLLLLLPVGEVVKRRQLVICGHGGVRTARRRGERGDAGKRRRQAPLHAAPPHTLLIPTPPSDPHSPRDPEVANTGLART